MRATWLLADSFLDYLPQARQPSSTLGTLPGLAASKYVPCTACGARGRVYEPGRPCASCPPLTNVKGDRIPPFRVGHGCRPCLVCEGHGWRRRRKNDPEIDAHAAIEVPKQEDAADISLPAIRAAIIAQRERPEIGHDALARTTHLLEAHERPEAEKFGWETAYERMCAHGSYAELRVALELLRTDQQPRYSIVWQVVCLHQPIRLSDGRQTFLNESMVELTVFMPDRIRVPRWLREDQRAKARKQSLWHGKSPAHKRERRERDDEIRRRRFEDKEPIGRLQRDYALSRMQIHRIIAAGREEPDHERNAV